jgi:2-polyprenyl-3-methyl-5-hydroxy-6-metoxy-1,4-benzoquinol methylase
MYNFIRNYCLSKVTSHSQYPKYIWKPKIVDVGCGSGVGTNVLSQEADFVWGIDKNAWSIEFANEAFRREKNGIYYSSQETFDVIDIMTENRELMKFDIVVAIEIIEHIHDTHKFLNQIIKHFTKRDKGGKPIEAHGTEFFISTPNRNSKKIKKEQPENIYHCREWTSQEFHELLSRYFGVVNLLNNKGEPVNIECNDDLVLAHCLKPRI